MLIQISKNGCTKNDVSISEALVMLEIANNVDRESTMRKLLSQGFVTAKIDEYGNSTGWRLSQKGNEALTKVILDSDKKLEEQKTIEDLAAQLKEVFPKGKKPGTNFYWAEGVALIVRRLQLFYKKYGTKYTDEQILSAAKRYIQDQNGNYKYTKLLKYFILKEKVGAGGDIEGESTLINYIENEGESNLSDDWTSDLR